jgi:hypothetical protein
MPNRYSKHAGAKLKEMLEALESEQNTHDLSDELDVARALCERSVRLFEAAYIEGGDAASPELKAMAGSNLRNALKHVTDTVHKSAQVQSIMPSIYDAKIMKHMVNNVMKVLIAEEMPTSVIELVEKRLLALNLPERVGPGQTTVDSSADEIAAKLREMGL